MPPRPLHLVGPTGGQRMDFPEQTGRDQGTVVTKKVSQNVVQKNIQPQVHLFIAIFNDIHLYATKVMKLEFSHNVDVGTLLISTSSTEIRVTQAVVATWTSFIRHDQACSNPIFAGGTKLVLLPDPQTTLR